MVADNPEHRAAAITQAYIFRIFGTKQALFLELVRASFERVTDGMRAAAAGKTGLDALSLMGRQHYELLTDRTQLLLQRQGLAACGDDEVRDAVRADFGAMWGEHLHGLLRSISQGGAA